MNFKKWLIKEETDLENPDIWYFFIGSKGITRHFLDFLRTNHINAINPNDTKFILDFIANNPKLLPPTDKKDKSEFDKNKKVIAEILLKAYKSLSPEQQNQYKELYSSKSQSEKLQSDKEHKEGEIKRELSWKNMVNMSDQDFEEFKKADMAKKLIMMKKSWQKNANREEWNSLKITHWAKPEDAIKLITEQVKPKELSATYYPSNQDMSKIGGNKWFLGGSVAIELKGNVTCGFLMDGQTNNYYDSMGMGVDREDSDAEKFGGRAWTLKPVLLNNTRNEVLIQDYKIEKVLIYDPNHHKKDTGQEEPEEIRKSYEYLEKLANEQGIPVEHIKTS
jgi:hypothetical protein